MTMTSKCLYALPADPAARDIIQRSIMAHPSLFRESLIRQANMHADYEQLTTNARAAQGANGSKLACLRAYDAVGEDDIEPIMADCSTMVVALNVACKLQCLPPHVRTAAAIKWDKGKR